jgi:hypothetical protein
MQKTEGRADMTKNEESGTVQNSLPEYTAKVLLLGGIDLWRAAGIPAADEAVSALLEGHAYRCSGLCCSMSQNGMRCCVPEAAVSRFRDAKIDLAALSRVPRECLQDVLEMLGSVKSIGAAQSRMLAQRPEIVLSNGVRLGFLYFSEGVNEDGFAYEADFWGDGVSDAVRMLLPQCDHVIILFRAGVQGLKLPLPELRTRCRRLIDAGASIVCGISPDTLMGWEEYGKGLIFYGLGSPAQTVSSDVRGSLAVSVAFQRNGKLSYEACLLEERDGALSYSGDETIKAKINVQNALLADEPAYLAQANKACLERYESDESALLFSETHGQGPGRILGLLLKRKQREKQEEMLHKLLSGQSLRYMTLRALEAKRKRRFKTAHPEEQVHK